MIIIVLILIGVFIGGAPLFFLRKKIRLMEKKYSNIILVLAITIFLLSLCFRFYEFHFNLTSYNYYKIADLCLLFSFIMLILSLILKIFKR